MRPKFISILILIILLLFMYFSLAEANSLIYQDPKESAFIISIPEGFRIKGGMIRPYQEPAIWLEVENNKEPDTIFYLSNPSVPFFIEPNEILLKKGILEGSKYKISNREEQFFVVKYMKATDYIRDLFLPQLKLLYKDLELYQLDDLTDLIKKNTNLEVLMISPEFSAASGIFEFSLKKKKMISKIFVITQKSLPRNDNFNTWQARVFTFHCPTKDFEKTNAIFTKILESFYLSADWSKSETGKNYNQISDEKLRENFIREKYRVFFKYMPV